jgi:hypothetical protein
MLHKQPLVMEGCAWPLCGGDMPDLGLSRHSPSGAVGWNRVEGVLWGNRRDASDR